LSQSNDGKEEQSNACKITKSVRHINPFKLWLGSRDRLSTPTLYKHNRIVPVVVSCWFV
jgi:hypothetical protein